MSWIGLSIIVIPLIYVVWEIIGSVREKVARSRELDRIQRRLAEKEVEEQ